MRIRELDLTAFGPFTDQVLTFEETGLHVVYGPNEAGKSSALRGLKALLYGVEERTLDNFLHASDKLRIKGCLRTADGHELTIVRRKGRKNTLLTPSDSALDEQVLSPFLQGVSLELFETLFGIDHQALVRGGQEILEQKGEVGQALFSAALGSHTLHAVLGELEAEADALFRPRGSTQTINTALKAYTDLSREVKQQSLPSRQWDEHCRALARTTGELEKIQSELSHARVEVNRLQRIQRVLPKLARRREIRLALAALGDVVILSEDFSERRHKAVNGLETARSLARRAMPRLAGLKERLEEMSVNRELLDQAESIEALHARLGSYRKALQDRPHLEVERRALRADAEALLKDARPGLSLEDTDKLRPVLARRQTITELSGEKAVLASRVEQIETNLRTTEKRLIAARRERDAIPQAGPQGALHRAIAKSRKEGDLDALIQYKRSQIGILERECKVGLSRLSLWSGALEDLTVLAVPGRESIRVFENRYEEFGKRLERIEEKKEDVNESRMDTALRLDEIQRAGAVPTETILSDARSERDKVWNLLRRQWIDGEDISSEAARYRGEAPLPDAYETRVTEADELSDRLRREAERVHVVSGLLARQDSEKQQLEEIGKQLEAFTEEKGRLDAAWRGLWAPCGIVPRTPREMRFWLDDAESLRGRVGQLGELKREATEFEEKRSTHIQSLGDEIARLGRDRPASGELEAVLVAADMFAEELDVASRKRESLDKDVRDRQHEVGSLADDNKIALEKLGAWEAHWADLMRSIGLRSEALPSEVGEFLETARTVLDKQKEAENLRKRIGAIDEDAAIFRRQVEAMAAAIASDLTELAVEDTLNRLNSLLIDNRSRQTRLTQIEEQVGQTEQDLHEAGAAIAANTGILDALCVEAKCDDYNELDVAERTSARCLQLRAENEAIETDILETGGGASIAKLEAETEQLDPDALPGRIDELVNKIEIELEPRRTGLAETKGREEKELEIMDGGDEAAVLADRANTILAGIRAAAERYVRLKLAGRVLRDEIERYRKKNQGPLVKRASAHFATLTLGSFHGLQTDFNDKDEPVLAGIRPGEERVHVEGMSSGTRDQLYLALRLASLEKYMESAEPMPFIVDDILVDFDDDRSRAALEALAELAEKTQIILFTHHAQVVGQARGLQKPAQVHEL